MFGYFLLLLYVLAGQPASQPAKPASRPAGQPASQPAKPASRPAGPASRSLYTSNWGVGGWARVLKWCCIHFGLETLPSPPHPFKLCKINHGRGGRLKNLRTVKTTPLPNSSVPRDGMLLKKLLSTKKNVKDKFQIDHRGPKHFHRILVTDLQWPYRNL